MPVMNHMDQFSNFILGGRVLKHECHIKKWLAQSETFTTNNDNIENLHLLEIFRTSRQRTWLVSTDNFVYCILDDTKEDEPKIRWCEDRQSLLEVATPSGIKVETDWSSESGKIDIGPNHKGWLYSRYLLPDEDSVLSKLSSVLKHEIV